MKVPNNYRLGTAISYGVTTNVPRIKKLEHLYSDDSYGNSGGFVLPLRGKNKGFIDENYRSLILSPMIENTVWVIISK